MPPPKWGSRPARGPNKNADALDIFVRARDEGKTKRLNTEILAALHARVKSGGALEGRDMTQVVIKLLEQRFPAQRQETHCRRADLRLHGLEQMSS